MEQSLLRFIWRHSRRDQIVLVAVTLLLFPLLFLTLELPKRIINDAIGAGADRVDFLGMDLSQTTLLVVLSFAFLGSVIVHGLLKMRVNTMKGVLAERLLRRFRFALIGRILRFPRSYQQQTSEGELVAALTAEAEPLGGIMGDAIALPLLQTGQMLTILLFLLMQNIWFGLAAIAMIPLQAWLIPRLQKRINVLNRSRVRQVRSLAGEVGEITTGAAILRQHGAWGGRMAGVSARLGRLFITRFDIYRKKFFMKFVNNLLTQITPFFFFLVGGLLVIKGQLTLGALVASLAAFKDLSAPWKELLTYYTAVQEVSQRYHMIVERFAPPDMLTDFLQEPAPSGPPAKVTAASLGMTGVTIQDVDGRSLLNEADLSVPAGQWLYVTAPQEDSRAVLAQAIMRDLAPTSGQITLNAQDISTLTQRQIAGLVGHATATPHIFRGTVGENVMLPLIPGPALDLGPDDLAEARRSGNQPGWQADQLPSSAQIETAHADWRRLVHAVGADKTLLARSLDQFLDPGKDIALQSQLAGLRQPIAARLEQAGLAHDILSFGDQIYFDDLTLAENLLVALKDKDDWIGPNATRQLRSMLVTLGLLPTVISQSLVLAQTLIDAFDADTASSLVFRRLGIPSDILPQLQKLIDKPRDQGGGPLKLADEMLLLSLQFNVPARAFDRAFSAQIKTAVVAARGQAALLGRQMLAERYAPLDASQWNCRLSVFENLIFGKIKPSGRQDIEQIQDEIVQTLIREIDEVILFQLIQELPTGLRGTNLSAQIAEHISLAQVIVKKPALVILDRAMASFPQTLRQASFDALRDMLPDATIVQLEPDPPATDIHDRLLELRQGQLVSVGQDVAHTPDDTDATDLSRKLAALRQSPLFRELSRTQLRLLAFSARWVEWPAGRVVFRKNDQPDGAYLIYAGTVELFDQDAKGQTTFSVTPPLGTLVGELGLIRNDPRSLSMRAQTDITLLRIDAEDFLSILETDARTAFKLIQHLVGYLSAGR